MFIETFCFAVKGKRYGFKNCGLSTTYGTENAKEMLSRQLSKINLPFSLVRVYPL